MLPYTEATNSSRLAGAAHRLMQAERTGDADAIQKAQVYLKFYEDQVSAEGLRERATAQAEADYQADPEEFMRRRLHDDALAANTHHYLEA